KRISAAEGKDAVYSPLGDLIAYVRGPGVWYRKSYRGSSNDDIWICRKDGTNNQRLTTHLGQDNSPMWAPDGQTLYYVSDCPGPAGTPATLARATLLNSKCGLPTVSGPVQPLTFHKDDAVRKARLSGNGEWIVYECGFDLWVVATKGGQPRKLAIEVY